MCTRAQPRRCTTGIVFFSQNAGCRANPESGVQEQRGAGACQHAEHSLPFGLGPRMCLGRYLVEASLKVLAVELARACTWQLQDEQERWSVFPTVRPQSGLPVHILHAAVRMTQPPQ